ncbi:MAG: hypothetical protein WCQ99_11865 [Pseudomonadota bacterium]
MGKGYDPVHAMYVNTQNLLSFFAEQISAFTELKSFCTRAAKAEDIYLPSGPPLSPLTNSYYSLWLLCDLVFGPDRETIIDCFLGVGPGMNVTEMHLKAAFSLKESRMGIYEHMGTDKKTITLKELLTEKTYRCICPSGYEGRKGELWYVRLVPDPLHTVDYFIIFTTPYVIYGHAIKEWEAYFARNDIDATQVGYKSRLDKLMKYGPSIHYWHEYVFLSYSKHSSDVIYLTGIPDCKATLPHAEHYA